MFTSPNRNISQIFVGKWDEFFKLPVNTGAVHFTFDLSLGIYYLFWCMALEKIVEGSQYCPNEFAHSLKPAPVHKCAPTFGVLALVPLSSTLALTSKAPLYCTRLYTFVGIRAPPQRECQAPHPARPSTLMRAQF